MAFFSFLFIVWSYGKISCIGDNREEGDDRKVESLDIDGHIERQTDFYVLQNIAALYDILTFDE